LPKAASPYGNESSNQYRQDGFRGYLDAFAGAKNVYGKSVKCQDIASAAQDALGEKSLLGQEQANGKTVDKYKVVSKVSGKDYVMYQWIARDSKIPVKSQAADGAGRRSTIMFRRASAG